ncbi:MAG: tRNA (adenosine(37)-N6)-threonylcarbamoyltransferase complex transferase subunit TsaD [Magnetococcales bacterium]|nr:tRNA (adenosine(37)-N6)-threonylcarbamoyltransferase complex transferase subunit TsaD [Magnetococcales bacterium]PPR15741.1 MAG: tRNA N6-adenosine threonylcarbamoyltransferase [Pseudomonadota bacterium]
MYILGIESSCDETAAAVLSVAKNQQINILSNVVYSQTSEHIEYGGVVPEIASRAHMERMDDIVKQALDQAQISLRDIHSIAYTQGPGLLGGLIVAQSFAKSLHLATGKQIVGVNHLEGHALTAHLTENLSFPYLLLLVSGGHCQFIHVRDLSDYEIMGSTLDDSIGECFDKVAKMLGLPYPGGPNIEKIALNGNPQSFSFPITLQDGSVNFSFSGLKSAIRRQIDQLSEEEIINKMPDICASFQETVARILEKKCLLALQKSGSNKLVLAGGVAANKLLRERLNNLCNGNNVTFHAPPLKLCTDNAVMIAYAGALRVLNNKVSNAHYSMLSAQPRWPLDKLK